MHRDNREIALNSLALGTKGLHPVTKPVLGWLRVVRQAVGLSRPQLAKKLNVSPGAVRDYESAEAEDRITIGTFRRVARSLGCDLILALVPQRERTFHQLADMLDPHKINDRAVEHSMTLEGQGTSAVESHFGEIGTLKSVRNVVEQLSSAGGRLNSDRIRTLFNLTRAEFAPLVGVSAATIRRSPDGAQLQHRLRPFARVSWLLAFIKDKKTFATWLRSKNDELDGLTPLELIMAGRIEIVAALVEDILINRGR